MIVSQLQELAQKIKQKAELEALLPRWKTEYRELEQLTQTLHTAMVQEQNDVDKLEAGGIGTVIHKLTGRMEEKLDKERLEAETASMEYHSATSRLKEMEKQIHEGETKLDALSDCKQQYIQIMQQQITTVEAILQNTEDPDLENLLKLRLQLERRRKSLREALLESSEAAMAAKKNLDILLLAQNSMPESQNHDIASDAIFFPQILLEEITDLQSKLAQMGIDPEPHLTVDSYLRAPAAFLAGAGADAAQSVQFQKASQQLEELQNQIISLEEKLNQALAQIESKLDQINE